MGLKKEMISDLEIGRGEANTSGLTPAEAEAFSILDRVVSDAPLPLSQFRTAVRDSASSNHSDYVSFQADTKQALIDENLLDERELLPAVGCSRADRRRPAGLVHRRPVDRESWHADQRCGRLEPASSASASSDSY